MIRASPGTLLDLPNIGKACARDLRLLGIDAPHELIGKCPFDMYERLCTLTACRHDPCMIDVFMSVTCFMTGEDARPWWDYTQKRKRLVLQRAKRSAFADAQGLSVTVSELKIFAVTGVFSNF